MLLCMISAAGRVLVRPFIADAIGGHAPDSVAKAYETVTLATIRDANVRIPAPTGSLFKVINVP